MPWSSILIVFSYAHGARHLNSRDTYFLAPSLIILVFDSENGENLSITPTCCSLISSLKLLKALYVTTHISCLKLSAPRLHFFTEPVKFIAARKLQ